MSIPIPLYRRCSGLCAVHCREHADTLTMPREVNPKVFRTRLHEQGADDVVWSEEACAALAGQVTTWAGEFTEAQLQILRAWVEDGWVVADVRLLDVKITASPEDVRQAYEDALSGGPMPGLSLG